MEDIFFFLPQNFFVDALEFFFPEIYFESDARFGFPPCFRLVESITDIELGFVDLFLAPARMTRQYC